MSKGKPHHYRDIPKTLDFRIGELVDGLSVLRDSISLLRSGHAHQILPLSGQLRALLTDKTGDPLLLDLADEMDQELTLFVNPRLPGQAGPRQNIPDVIHAVSGIYATTERKLPEQERVLLVDYLDEPVINYRNANHAPRDVITFFANKAGGAHYDTAFPRDLGDLMSQVYLGNMPEPAQVLFQIGQATYQLGLELLRKLGNIELHFLIHFCHGDRDVKHHIISGRVPERSVRIVSFVDPIGRLHVGVTGLDGRELKIPAFMDWSRTHHVTMALGLTDDLTSMAKLIVDGEIAESFTVESPLLLPPNLDNYDIKLNYDPENQWSVSQFAIADLRLLAAHENTYNRGQLYNEYRENCDFDDKEFWAFCAGKSSHIGVGSTDPEPDPTRITNAELSDGWCTVGNSN